MYNCYGQLERTSTISENEPYLEEKSKRDKILNCLQTEFLEKERKIASI